MKKKIKQPKSVKKLSKRQKLFKGTKPKKQKKKTPPRRASKVKKLSQKKTQAVKPNKSIVRPSPSSAVFSPMSSASSLEPWRKPAAYSELPDRYGESFVFIMIKDPLHIFAYWEIHPDHEEWALAQLGGNWYYVKSVLRVFDVTNSSQDFYDTVLTGNARNWYLDVQPDHSYIVELGLRHQDGRYLMLVRSNQVRMPRMGMSDVLDEKWMDIDFEKMFALSGGWMIGLGSEQIRKMLEQRLLNMQSSGMRSAPTSGLPTLPSI